MENYSKTTPESFIGLKVQSISDLRKGIIVEVDLPAKRARVKWASNRTWMRFSNLKITD
jgi:hypothetical protein